MAFKDQVNVIFDALEETATKEIDISRYTKGIAQLEATLEGTPTAPTLNVSLEYSLDGKDYQAFGTPIAFTEAEDTLTADWEVINLTALPAKFLQIKATVGGTGYDGDNRWENVKVKFNLER